jgi:hypothetical protein
MKKKTIRLTESDLTRLVKRVINETLTLRDDDDFKDIDRTKRPKYRWNVGNDKRFVDYFEDKLSFRIKEIIDHIRLPNNCKNLQHAKTMLKSLENTMYDNNELTDGEVKHYTELIKFYNEVIDDKLEEC